ncbi:MAG: hypothetical protein B6241_10545 [Spirochaetaceae bacterium 4572_59]|nr:MAG: hypothetical protein B6241_10545 [Spirochaetaceae bacterium 4572_59]
MKKTLCLLLTALSVSLLLPAQNILNENGFELSLETRSERLIVTIKAPTIGWIAFATGATDKMKDANIIIVWVDDMMGIAMGEDHFGTSPLSHKNDMELGGSQDLQVLSGKQTGEYTLVSFSLPLNSGDKYDTELVRGKTYPLLLASGKSDNISEKLSPVYTGKITIP